MGKRSHFARLDRDCYDTPPAALAPLLPHLAGMRRFAEPCAGAGALIGGLEAAGLACMFAGDIAPRAAGIAVADAHALTIADLAGAEAIITNPPWSRAVLHPLIQRFAGLRPTWLLLDADWMHTRQAVPYLALCLRIVSVGRVKWMPGSAFTGMDNAAWYLFSARAARVQPGPVFVARDGAGR